jgi:hypothetical protein
MKLPSKELLEKITNDKIQLGVPIVLKDNEVVYKYASVPIHFYERHINIYELMHLMKEWAFNNGFACISGTMNGLKQKIAILTSLDVMVPKIPFTESTEFEAVTEACEWLLKETK